MDFEALFAFFGGDVRPNARVAVESSDAAFDEARCRRRSE